MSCRAQHIIGGDPFPAHRTTGTFDAQVGSGLASLPVGTGVRRDTLVVRVGVRLAYMTAAGKGLSPCRLRFWLRPVIFWEPTRRLKLLTCWLQIRRSPVHPCLKASNLPIATPINV